MTKLANRPAVERAVKRMAEETIAKIADVSKTKSTVVSKIDGKPLKAKTGPKGWRIKNYFVDQKAFAASKTELEKAPNQVKIMMNHFAAEFGDAGKASQGRTMCESAINKGGLKTVIEPHVLFAYYRKTMETFGLRLKD